MAQVTINTSDMPLMKDFCSFADGYARGVADATDLLKIRLIEQLATRKQTSSPTAPGSGEHGPTQEPANADT
jgi:hypothetical protein